MALLIRASSPYVEQIGGVIYIAKTETIRTRGEPELKQEAEAVLKALELNASEAITIFYCQVALEAGCLSR
jgi:uncharacterized membrane protein